MKIIKNSKQLIALTVFIIMAICVASLIAHSSRRSLSSDVKTFNPGKSTLNDVEKAFGPNYEKFIDSDTSLEWWVYHDFPGKKNKFDMIIFIFNKNGFLVKHGLVTDSFNQSEALPKSLKKVSGATESD